MTGIDPDVRSVEPGETPRGGTPLTNGFGSSGWGARSRPRGMRRTGCFFRLYALPDPVRVPDNASAEDVHRAAHGAALASGNIVGLYQR
ncbi:hypothetical protein [Streptomyces spirodelae]|uniref:Uncharacterized protein n=1 Tax=Streptomyces spirodelae TaxID=2812904 RepID=A0ABS3WQZ9_9ACTN|nr:hypothetical protein [Streptomyces spirodelae]MBO8185287.1 hypothetical protein [Streptomyces spirodelae]